MFPFYFYLCDAVCALTFFYPVFLTSLDTFRKHPGTPLVTVLRNLAVPDVTGAGVVDRDRQSPSPQRRKASRAVGWFLGKMRPVFTSVTSCTVTSVY